MIAPSTGVAREKAKALRTHLPEAMMRLKHMWQAALALRHGGCVAEIGLRAVCEDRDEDVRQCPLCLLEFHSSCGPHVLCLLTPVRKRCLRDALQTLPHVFDSVQLCALCSALPRALNSVKPV